MVGHTGNMHAAVKALEVVDECVQKIHEYCIVHGYVLCITADHGNAEEMDGIHKTSHTTNLVPFCIVEHRHGKIVQYRLKRGILGNIAPTILKLMGLNTPSAMKCTSLF